MTTSTGSSPSAARTERDGALPPLRGGGRGHLGDEALLRRAAARTAGPPPSAGPSPSTSASSMPWTSPACSPCCPACGTGRTCRRHPRLSRRLPGGAGLLRPGRPSPRRTPTGVCVYCNHCQPCPAGLDVGLINKYYDLARAGDALASGPLRQAGASTPATASGCGHCDRRCPFHVAQSRRMQEIRQLTFGA